MDIRKYSQAASMFLGFSHGACVPNGAALRTSTEAGSFVGEQYCSHAQRAYLVKGLDFFFVAEITRRHCVM